MKYRLIRNRNLVEDEDFAGYNGENRAEKLEFEIPENLRNYAITINFETEDEKFYDILDEDYTYTLKNNVTKYNFVNFYLKFMKQLDEVTYEIVKTEVKRLRIRSSFETEQEITEEEIEVLDRVLAQMLQATDRANAIAEDLENKVATDYYRGATGENGADAKINGVNTLTIEAGDNITLDQEGSTLTINSTGGGGGTSNYNALTNKPKINNVELNGNKSLNDLGIQPVGNYALESEIPTKTSDLTNDSGFIDKNVNNLTNYYKTSETYNKTEIDNKISSVYKYKGTVATYANLPSSDLTVGDVYNVESTGDNYAWTGTVWDKLGGDIDLSGYQPKIDSTHKLSSDLVDDTGNTNKFVTSTDKTNWNAKYDKPSGGIPKTDLSSDVQTSLGKADTAIQEHQDISGKANKISVVQSSASTIEINSNTFYKFGEVASLNITLASITDNTIYNEYMFEFVSGTTATTLTLPSSIKWLETPTIDANKIYQCSIVDNVGILVGVANV